MGEMVFDRFDEVGYLQMPFTAAALQGVIVFGKVCKSVHIGNVIVMQPDRFGVEGEVGLDGCFARFDEQTALEAGKVDGFGIFEWEFFFFIECLFGFPEAEHEAVEDGLGDTLCPFGFQKAVEVVVAVPFGHRCPELPHDHHFGVWAEGGRA